MTGTGDAATLDAIRIVVALLAVAAVTAVVASRLRISYTVSLVVLGLVAGAFLLHAGRSRSRRSWCYLVLVPGLVFEAALQFDAEHLRRTIGWMVLLAAPGVVLSAVIVAAVLDLATGLPFEFGLVVGAMVAATDPVAVIATFRSLGVRGARDPRRGREPAQRRHRAGPVRGVRRGDQQGSRWRRRRRPWR